MKLFIQFIALGGIVKTGDIHLTGGLSRGLVHKVTGHQLAHQRSQVCHHLIDLTRCRYIPISCTCHFCHELGHILHDREHQIHAVDYIAGIIQTAQQIGEFFAPLHIKAVPCLRNFIADGIQDHAGVVIILVHHMGDVIFPPVRHGHAVIQFHLGAGPYIGKLIHHIHTQPVAGLQKPSAHRIVGAADGIKAGFLQVSHPHFLCMGKFCGANHAVVMMQTTAPQLYFPAVDPQPMLRIQLQSADAKGSFLPVTYHSIHHQLCPIGIQVRILCAPRMRLRHIQILPVDTFLIFHHSKRHGCLCRQLLLRIIKLHLPRCLLHALTPVLHLRLCPDHCLILLQIRDGQMDTCTGEVHPVRLHDMHIPVDTAAGIPTTTGAGIFHHYLYLVGTAYFQIFGNVRIEISIAIGVLSHKGMVYIQKGILIDALKLQREDLIPVCLLRCPGLFIDTAVLMEKAITAAAGILTAALLMNGRIMRQIHFLTLGRIAHQTLKNRAGGFAKLPVSVKAFFDHLV